MLGTLTHAGSRGINRVLVLNGVPPQHILNVLLRIVCRDDPILKLLDLGAQRVVHLKAGLGGQLDSVKKGHLQGVRNDNVAQIIEVRVQPLMYLNVLGGFVNLLHVFIDHGQRLRDDTK